MNAFPIRAQQLPTASGARPQPAEAASQAASWAMTQPAAHPQHLQSAIHPPAESPEGSAQIQAQTAAVDCQPPAQLPAASQLNSPAEHGEAFRDQAVSAAGDVMPSQPAERLLFQANTLQSHELQSVHALQTAMLSGSVHHSPQESLGPQAAMHSGSENAALSTAPIPEAAKQDTLVPASRPQKQTPRDQPYTPSILQDLRDAAAQDCVHQLQDPLAPTAGLSNQQAQVEPMQMSQPASLELQSSQETTSMQAHRLSTAIQSAGTLPLTPEKAVPDAMPADQVMAAGSHQGRQPAVASQTVVSGSTAFAEHSDSLSTVPVMETAVTAVEEKQPVVRSQRLSEKKAAAARAVAQAAATAVVQAGDLCKQDTLAASVKQTGLGLASRVEVASSTVPLVLAECLASNRLKRVPGGNPLEVSPFPLCPLPLLHYLPPCSFLI